MRLLTPGEARRVAWKNGLGSTLEVATDAASPGGEWTWRLALADVPVRGPFSSYPGIDRFIACLSGPGLALELGGKRLAVPNEGEGLAFPGEEPVVGDPLGPGVRDANLMVRREKWRGSFILARGRGLALNGDVVIVHVPEGAPAVEAATSEGAISVPAGRTLIASGAVSVPSVAGSVVVACALTRPARSSGSAAASPGRPAAAPSPCPPRS